MAPQGFDRGKAGYTVAGWWTDSGQDPLAGAAGPNRLDVELAGLGWHVVHDGDDEALVEEDPRLARLRAGMGPVAPAGHARDEDHRRGRTYGLRARWTRWRSRSAPR